MDGARQVDFENQRVTVDGKRVDLTPLEWLVVERLADRSGRAVARAEIAQLIGKDNVPASDNAVAVHLYNLRRKLGRDAIETIRGRGFRLKL
ncbi:MAG: winged helix-turn-helix domain-containing protein [Piscinibacter sp.]